MTVFDFPAASDLPRLFALLRSGLTSITPGLMRIGERALQLFCDRLIEAIKPFQSAGALAISARRRASVVDQAANPFVARFAVGSGYRSRARRAEGAFAPYQ